MRASARRFSEVPANADRNRAGNHCFRGTFHFAAFRGGLDSDQSFGSRAERRLLPLGSTDAASAADFRLARCECRYHRSEFARRESRLLRLQRSPRWLIPQKSSPVGDRGEWHPADTV